MNFSIQQALLLVLGALVPPVVFIVERSEIFVAITLVNVLLIWASLRIATGGSLLGIGGEDDGAVDPEQV